MLITKNNHWNQGERKHTINRELKLGPMTVKVATIALIALAALFYLAQSAQAASQKYQIMQLSSQKQDLDAESKDLQVQAARLKSLNQINQSTQSLGLQPVGKASFAPSATNQS